MKIKIECDLIESIQTTSDKKAELTIINPIISEYEEMDSDNIMELIGREETNDLIKNHFMDYIEESETRELLRKYLALTKQLSDRNVNIKEKI